MNVPKRRTALFAATLVAVALVGSACGSSGNSGGGDAGKPVTGGTLNMLGVGDVDYMDPNATYYSTGYTASRLYSRQLFTFPVVEGQTLKVVPDLATELPTVDNGGISADGKTYTFKLREGVKWNTSPARNVTAADFVRGVKRTCNPVQPFGASGYFTGLIEGMDKFCTDFQAPYSDGKTTATAADIKKYVTDTDLPGIVAKDDTTIEVHLTRPASYFVDMLALVAFSPAPVEVLDYLPASAELGKHQISDGPYQIDKYEPTKSIEFSRNPVWDAKTDPVRKAYVDKIVVNETGEQANIQQQLETGNKNADMEWDTFPVPTDVPGLKAKNDKNLTISDTSSSNPYVVYNVESPNNNKIMSKLAFRQGLSHAINRDNILQVLGGKLLNGPLTHVLPPTILGSEDVPDMYPYDIAKAKSLMASAGANKPTIKILYRNESKGSTKTFETLQQDLTKVGIKVVGVPASNADFYTKWLQSPDKARQGGFDIATAGWGSDWYGNAALSYFGPLFNGKASFPPNGSNFGLYDSQKTNDLIKQASEAADADSAALWAQADKQVMEDAAFFPLTNPKTANYHSSHLHNTVYLDAFQNYDPANVWIDKAGQE